VFNEALPGGVAHLRREREVTPEINPRTRHAKLKLAWVKEEQRRSTTNQCIGVRCEAKMHALKSGRPRKSLSGGEEAHMPTVQPVKNSKGQD
jgi:hypothetical protein